MIIKQRLACVYSFWPHPNQIRGTLRQIWLPSREGVALKAAHRFSDRKRGHKGYLHSRSVTGKTYFFPGGNYGKWRRIFSSQDLLLSIKTFLPHLICWFRIILPDCVGCVVLFLRAFIPPRLADGCYQIWWHNISILELAPKHDTAVLAAFLFYLLRRRKDKKKRNHINWNHGAERPKRLKSPDPRRKELFIL